MISPEDKELIQSQNIFEVISKYVELKKKGSEWKGLSPFVTEKTASFTVSEPKNIWKCFSSGKGGIGPVTFVMEHEQIPWYQAMIQVASQMNIVLQGVEMKVHKPTINKRSLKEGEVPGTKLFEYKDFTDAELSLLGPRVNDTMCKAFKLESCKMMTIIKDKEAFEISSTDDFPIFVFDFGTWQKIYQPKADKDKRFTYAGEKPKKYLFGLDLIKAAYEKRKAEVSSEDYTGTDTDPRIDSAFIMSGGSDGINIYSFGKFPIWGNSEHDHLEWDDYSKLKTWVKNIYYVGDLDSTGEKQAIEIGLKYLDIKLVWLPKKLMEFKDSRGNSCKDFKDYVTKFYRKDNPKAFENMLNKLIENSLQFQFWDSWAGEKKTEYYLSNTRLYHFLSKLGFGKYENENLKDGYIYVRKVGSIIKLVEPYQVENFIHTFLEERQMPTGLRDYVYKNNQLGEKSISKLPTINVDFEVADRHTQYLFFPDKVWKITAVGVEEFKPGGVDRFIWEDKVIQHPRVKLKEAPFRIFEDEHGNLDIEILQKDNIFLNYLINTSRVHWRKELEDSFENNPKAAEEYAKNNKFNIAGDNLNDDEKYEQKLHLINKIYSIGYLLHQYKNESKAWAVFAMDNKISDLGESHGGSGKSIAYSNLHHILKRRVVLKGRDPKLTQNDFIYSNVTEDTDYILIDDAHAYLNFDFFFSEITGSLIVNPKNSKPFEIPFSKAPKFVITSNFSLRDVSPSTARRLLYTVFSDYYHYNKNGEYKQERQVSDDFDGRNLFKDFIEEDWANYFLVAAYSIHFFLEHPSKIDPPMGNVEKRNLLTEMTQVFKDWADIFFMTEDLEQNYIYLNQFFSKEKAIDQFFADTKQKSDKWSSQRFKKSMMAYCRYNGWVFNPTEYLDKDGSRIMKKFEGKTQEMLYISTVFVNGKPEIPEEIKTNKEVVIPNSNYETR